MVMFAMNAMQIPSGHDLKSCQKSAH